MSQIVLSGSDRRSFRGGRLRFSVLTSLFSKAATFSINFLALPLLFRCLGARDFALYATLNSAAAWLVYANLGIGPKLITSTATAFSKEDKQRVRQLFSSVIYPVIAIATLVGIGLLTFVFWGQPELALGENFRGQSSLIRIAATILIGVAWFQTVASVYEAVQTGYHEQGILNLFFGIGNVVSLVALIVLVRVHPTIVGAICCLTLPIALARASNILVLRSKHPEFQSKLNQLDWRVSRDMLRAGLGYSMISVGSFLNHQFPVLLVNHVLVPSLTSTTATLLNINNLATGLVTMITIPMCASIADSLAHRDFEWIRRFLRRLLGGTTAYALLVGLVLCTVGSKLLLLAFGKQLVVQTATLALVSTYLLLVLFEHVLVMTLIALGRIWQTASLYLLRGLIAVALVPAATRVFGINGVFIVLAVSAAMVTIPTYSFQLRYTFRRLQNSSKEQHNLESCELSPVSAH